MPTDEWHVTTDHDRIRQWATARDLVPARDESETSDVDLALVSDPGARDAEGLADVERITWDQFFELFEAEELALEFRDADPEAGAPTSRLVDRRTVEEVAVEEGSGTAPVASDRIATSDTGDAEPVVDQPVESRTDEPAVAESDRERGSQSPKRHGDASARTSPESESASGAEEPPVVLEELYEDPGGFGDGPGDEYLVLRNDGDERLELGGWRVENDLGRRYEFPEGFVLGPGEEVTLRSDAGEDGDHELHWGADGPVWDQQGGVVVVRAPDGRRVIREPYKDGPGS